MKIIQCPHCKTRVVTSPDGVCPSCRKSVDAPVDSVEESETLWDAALPGAGTSLVTVARFVDPVRATMAKNCLEDAGFEAFLADAETVSVAWQLSNALGGIKLQVAGPDAARARTVLREQLDGSAGDREDLIREATATTSATGEGGEDVPPDDDGTDGPEPTSRENDAERAFRCAVFGLLFFPLQFYASFLLLKVLFSSEVLAGRSRGRAFIATAINVTFLLILAGFGSALMGVYG
jgi:hypothetical protein